MGSIKKSLGGSSFSKTKSLKELPCKLCGTKVKNVDINATAVTCWKCVSGMCSRPQTK